MNRLICNEIYILKWNFGNFFCIAEDFSVDFLRNRKTKSESENNS